jgi:hypothetical protein
MPIFKCHLILTVADEHTATVEVEADTADAAMNLLSDTEIGAMQRQPDYDSADRSDARFIRCTIDGLPAPIILGHRRQPRRRPLAMMMFAMTRTRFRFATTSAMCKASALISPTIRRWRCCGRSNLSVILKTALIGMCCHSGLTTCSPLAMTKTMMNRHPLTPRANRKGKMRHEIPIG